MRPNLLARAVHHQIKLLPRSGNKAARPSACSASLASPLAEREGKVPIPAASPGRPAWGLPLYCSVTDRPSPKRNSALSHGSGRRFIRSGLLSSRSAKAT
jgi:hypothetical protein